ncbi:hypothetical protein B0A48_14431 [Cryoendolithus antarcticus]|uniref:F-box domain-containing protein n=1 Tax=Cryoendolithus antarcticus TaxID=1507870 RepID=A0A1V8SJW0_9PEZI|nr:hypothetical protein B0A48_14431 [Cryoendolithus antarcticus]
MNDTSGDAVVVVELEYINPTSGLAVLPAELINVIASDLSSKDLSAFRLSARALYAHSLESYRAALNTGKGLVYTRSGLKRLISIAKHPYILRGYVEIWVPPYPQRDALLLMSKHRDRNGDPWRAAKALADDDRRKTRRGNILAEKLTEALLCLERREKGVTGSDTLGSIRVLYTYPAIHSPVEFTHFPDVVAKIESVTIGLVAPKWRECPPSSVHEQLTSVAEQVATAKLYRWLYSDSAVREPYTREYESALLTAFDNALLSLEASRTHVNFRIAYYDVEGDFGGMDDDARSATVLKPYMGGRRLDRLNSTQAVSLLLCALARTDYGPASMDLDCSARGSRAPFLEGAFVLHASLKHPKLARLTTLKLHLNHADFYDFASDDPRFARGVIQIGEWLAVMPGLEFLSIRFAHDPPRYEEDLSNMYTVTVTGLVHGLRHAKLRSLVLD